METDDISDLAFLIPKLIGTCNLWQVGWFERAAAPLTVWYHTTTGTTVDRRWIVIDGRRLWRRQVLHLRRPVIGQRVRATIAVRVAHGEKSSDFNPVNNSLVVAVHHLGCDVADKSASKVIPHYF